MVIWLIVAVVVAVVYLYASVAYYYNFKNWTPMCGCSRETCKLDNPKPE